MSENLLWFIRCDIFRRKTDAKTAYVKEYPFNKLTEGDVLCWTLSQVNGENCKEVQFACGSYRFCDRYAQQRVVTDAWRNFQGWKRNNEKWIFQLHHTDNFNPLGLFWLLSASHQERAWTTRHPSGKQKLETYFPNQSNATNPPEFNGFSCYKTIAIYKKKLKAKAKASDAGLEWPTTWQTNTLYPSCLTPILPRSFCSRAVEI